jgi:DNA-binding transcriptional LysR family regulator
MPSNEYRKQIDSLSIIDSVDYSPVMNMTLRQLQIFMAVAQTGSTTAAALSVPLSQSATSAALAELERGLKTTLFDRVGKRLLLNDSGRLLLPLVLGVLDGARNIESVFLSSENAVRLDLKLYASTTIGNYILPKLLSSFGSIIPTTRLDVRIGNTLEVVDAVCDFSTDLGLIEGPCHAPDIVVTRWLADELVIVAAPSHPLAKSAAKRKLTIAQLCQAPWLLREPGSGTREAVEAALLQHFSNIQATMTLGSSEAIKNSVVEGVGISWLSRAVVADLLAAKRLTILATHLPPLTRVLSLIHHRNKVLSAGLSAFLKHCQAFAKAA